MYTCQNVWEVNYTINDQPVHERVTTSHIIILVFCVCLSVPPEISGTRGRITMLLTPSWRASPGELHKLLFEPTLCAFWEKSFRNFFASYALNPVHAPLHFRLPWAGWIFPARRKPLEHSQGVCVEGHTLHIMGTIVAIAFYMNGV